MKIKKIKIVPINKVHFISVGDFIINTETIKSRLLSNDYNKYPPTPEILNLSIYRTFLSNLNESCICFVVKRDIQQNIQDLIKLLRQEVKIISYF